MEINLRDKGEQSLRKASTGKGVCRIDLQANKDNSRVFLRWYCHSGPPSVKTP